jgi:hypothetical protein
MQGILHIFEHITSDHILLDFTSDEISRVTPPTSGKRESEIVNRQIAGFHAGRPV